MRRSKGIKFVSTPLDSEEVETTAGACATIYDSGDTDKSQRSGKREDPCQTCPTGYYRVHTCYRSFPSTVNTVVHIFQFFKMIFSFRNCSQLAICSSHILVAKAQGKRFYWLENTNKKNDEKSALMLFLIRDNKKWGKIDILLSIKYI